MVLKFTVHKANRPFAQEIFWLLRSRLPKLWLNKLSLLNIHHDAAELPPGTSEHWAVILRLKSWRCFLYTMITAKVTGMVKVLACRAVLAPGQSKYCKPAGFCNTIRVPRGDAKKVDLHCINTMAQSRERHCDSIAQISRRDSGHRHRGGCDRDATIYIYSAWKDHPSD
jgi:hypothetical protein